MDKSNEIRIGPITRARAKLLEQQVNLFLIESDVLLNEDFILPKSLYICVIRYKGVIQEKDEGQGQVHEEKSREKTKGEVSQLEESDVRTTSRTVRAPSRTSDPPVGPSEQLRSRRPEDLTN